MDGRRSRSTLPETDTASDQVEDVPATPFEDSSSSVEARSPQTRPHREGLGLRSGRPLPVDNIGILVGLFVKQGEEHRNCAG